MVFTISVCIVENEILKEVKKKKVNIILARDFFQLP